MHDDSDPRLADFVIGGQTPEDAFANGALHACRQIEKRIVRESDESGHTSLHYPQRLKDLIGMATRVKCPKILYFEEYHTSLAPVETPNIDEYVRGKKRCVFYMIKRDLQAAATAEEEAENDT